MAQSTSSEHLTWWHKRLERTEMEETQMKGWLVFGLLLFVGLMLCIAGIFYTRQDKQDIEAVKIYRIVTFICVLMVVAAIVYRMLI